MKKALLFLISLLFGVGLFIWIGETVGWGKIKNAFLVFTGWQGIVIFSLTALIALVGTWRWKEILRGEEVKISFKNLINPYLAGFAIMFLAPILLLAGEFFRGYILKEKSSVPWSKGMASVMIDRILEWTANLVVVFFGALFFFYKIGLPPKNLGIIFGVALFLFTVLISSFYFKIFKQERIARPILRSLGLKNFNHTNSILDIEKEIFNFFKSKKLALWKALSLSFLRTVFMYFRTWLLIIFLGKSLGALPALSILGFTYLAAMIPIPTALGSHEAIQTFAFNSLGLGASTATAFTMIIRGAELLIALAGVTILLRLGISLLKNNLFKQ